MFLFRMLIDGAFSPPSRRALSSSTYIHICSFPSRVLLFLRALGELFPFFPLFPPAKKKTSPRERGGCAPALMRISHSPRTGMENLAKRLLQGKETTLTYIIEDVCPRKGLLDVSMINIARCVFVGDWMCQWIVSCVCVCVKNIIIVDERSYVRRARFKIVPFLTVYSVQSVSCGSWIINHSILD